MKRFVVCALYCLALVPAVVHAQNQPAPKSDSVPIASAPAPPPAPVPVPVKILVTLSRYSGEKKLSSYPYELYVLAARSPRITSLRVGMNTRMPTGPGSADNVWIGTKIDSSAEPSVDGRYRVLLQIEDSSIYTAEAAPSSSGLSSLRGYSLENMLLLRDGQTTQFSVGTDKVSGEVIKADVTLTVLK